MSEKQKSPTVAVLGPITPSAASARSEALKYEKLEEAVAKHVPYEQQRQDEFWEAAEGSMEEEKAARQLAMQYMLMGSLALNRANKPESKAIWSERWTEATSALYGAPDHGVARELFEQQEAGVEIEHPFGEIAAKLGEYLNAKYDSVYAALELDSAPDFIDADSIAARIESGLGVLAAEFDETWSEWSVSRPATDKLMVSKKTVEVGLDRASVTPMQLKELFTHEVLVHGLSTVNGAKHADSRAKTGFPGYLDAEEGEGIFSEYAVSGSVKDVVIDRYVDIGYALGAVDGQTHTREELIEHAMKRALMRNDKADIKKSPEDIEKEVYAHVNRIYRGSRGDENVGVFTKDIAYYQGFLMVGRFIESRLAAGEDIDAVWEYLMSGKFDPTNEEHVAAMAVKQV
jgi:hypothetical protein